MSRIQPFPLLCIVWFTSFVLGCTSTEHATIELHDEAPQTLSAEQARQAVLDLIRVHPEMFVGSPDPEKLAQLPLEERDDGEFAFGAIVVSTSERWYTADIGQDGPEYYHFSGSIEWRNETWVAGEPNVQRFHKMPD